MAQDYPQAVEIEQALALRTPAPINTWRSPQKTVAPALVAMQPWPMD